MKGTLLFLAACLQACLVFALAQMLYTSPQMERLGCAAQPGLNTVHGTVFYDDNGDGVFDPGEPGFPGAVLYLYADADSNGIADTSVALASTITDAVGEYSFDTALIYTQAFVYNQRIQASDDDAHEEDNGDVKETDNDIKVGKWDKLRHGGLRFTGLNLPAGTVVDSAFIIIDNGDGNDRISSFNVFSEMNASPLAYSDANQISTRPLSRDSVKFDVNWLADETDYKGPDVSTVVQEVVDSFGALTELAFILKNNADSDDEIKIIAYDDKPDQAARLVLYYNVPVAAAYHFIVELDTTGLPATSSMTTSTVQAAGFYTNSTASCEHDFGFDIGVPNGPPVASDDLDSTDAETPISIDVLINDSDPESDTLTITAISALPDHGGSAAINNNGTPSDPTDDFIDFTPQGSYFGLEYFEYVICDNVFPFGCDTAEAAVYIACVNDSVTVNAAVCLGDSFQVGSRFYSSAGTYETVIAKPHCDSVVTLVLSVDDPPGASDAGADQTLCNSSSFTMAANTPAIGTGVWTITSGSAAITAPASPTTTVTGIAAGTSATLRWTISNGVCTDSWDEVTVQNDELPAAADAGPDQTLCNTSSFTMAADAPAAGTGLWTITSGSAAITAPASPATTVTGVAAGTSVTLRWTVSNGVCADSWDELIIQNDEPPTTADAGPDQEICNNSAFTMAANTPSTGTGTWTVVSGSATITAPASPVTTVTGVASETSVTLRWTISNASCPDSQDDITVTNSNCPPTAVDDSDTTTPGAAIAIGVLANDSDPEGHTITITAVSAAPDQGGTAGINDNGTPGDPSDDFIDFTPSGIYIGTEYFDYVICDDRTPAGCDTATVTVVINANPPVAVNDAASTEENVAVAVEVTANDTDSDGDFDASTVNITVNPANGTITNISATGVVTYTPAAGFYGQDTFYYEVSDAAGATSNTAQVVISVEQNLPPVANDDNDVTTENNAVLVAVLSNDTDPNGDLDPFSVSTAGLLQPAHGTLSVVPGSGIQYTPDADYIGFDQFEYQVCDSSRLTPLCDVATVTVYVDCDGIATGLQNEISGTVFFDIDSSTTYGIGEAGYGNAAVYLYTDNDENGIPDGPAIQTTVSDANGSYMFLLNLTYGVEYSYDMRIQNENDDAHEEPNGDVKETDNDVKMGKDGTERHAGFRFTGLSIPADAVIDSAYLLIDNGDGNDRTSSVDIFGELSASPLAYSDANQISTRPKTAASVQFDIDWLNGETDYRSPDVSTLIQEVVDNVGAISEFAFIMTNNAFSTGDEIKVIAYDDKPLQAARLVIHYTEPGDEPYTFLAGIEPNSLPYSSLVTTSMYQAANFNAASEADCSNNFGFFLTDLSVNTAPAALDDQDTTVADVTIAVDVLANDSDAAGQQLIISAIVSAPDQGGTASIDDNGTPFIYSDDQIIFTPGGLYAGDETFQYSVCDNNYNALCDTATVVIHILPNIPPVAADDDLETYADLPLAIDVLVNDYDPDLDNIGVSAITTAPDYGGTAVINDNGTALDPTDDYVDYTPSGAFVGIETFYYAVCDDGVPNSRCDTAQVTIDIQPNTYPAAADDYDTTRADIPIAVDVLGNDTDPQAHQVPAITAITSAPDQGGTAVINDNGTPLDPSDDFIDYTPSGLYEGPESFDYVICDGGLPVSLCDTATAYIILLPNPVPAVVDDYDTLDQVITIPLYVLANDYDSIARQGIVYFSGITAAPDQGGTAIVNDNGTPALTTDDYIEYTPSGLFVGNETFRYAACDDGAPVKCDTAVVTITLLANANPPLASDDYDTTLAFPETIAIDILANDSEPDGHLFAGISISSAPDQGGSASINDNGTPLDVSDDYIEYTPSGLYSGVETFQYSLCDNGISSLCATATVYVTLLPNQPPVAVNDTTRVLENLPKTIAVLENDYDSTGMIEPADIAVIGGPSHGSVSIDPFTGEITYASDPGYTGPDQFTYVICDNGVPAPGLCDTALVVIEVISYINEAVLDSFHTGALIIDMDVRPADYGNSLLPYGLVYELVTTYSIPVSWAIKTDKSFDEIDFSHNGKDYRGGPFIIPFMYRSPAIDAVVDAWRAQGVVVDEAVSPFTAPIVDVIDGFGNVIIDDENNGIVEPYFENAGIPSSAYSVGSPAVLNKCNDLFVLPHANPDWPHHNELYDFNVNYGGYVYAACRAVSILESLRDPIDTTIQLNFLSARGLQCHNVDDCGAHIGQEHEKDPTLPYTYDSAWASVEVNQFMDDLYDATENGSEQWYIPIDGTQWNEGVVNMLMTSDTNDVGARGTKFIFGFGYDDPDNGMVYYHGGHRATNGSLAAMVSAQRAFFNFMFMASRKPSNNFDMQARVPRTCYTPGSVHQFGVEVTDGGSGPYTYTWSTTLDGTFSNPNDTATSFTLNSMDYAEGGTITVTVEDDCGRRKFRTFPINRIALDVELTQADCWGDRSASIDLSLDGDCGPYTYLWTPWGDTTQDMDSTYAGHQYVQITNSQGYSFVEHFWIIPREEVYCSGVLPVELSSFYGENRGQSNHLHWTTLSEINNDYFSVQRSRDAAGFEEIGTVGGMGTSITESSYDFIDSDPYPGVNYYRLQQFDFDGSTSYSRVIDLTVLSDATGTVTLWPNPTGGQLHVGFAGVFSGTYIDVTVHNMTGDVIRKYRMDLEGLSGFSLDLKDLPRGMYLVEIQNGFHHFSNKIVLK